MRNRLLTLVLSVVTGFGLSACEKKGPIKRPEPKGKMAVKLHVHGLAEVESKVIQIVEKFDGVSEVKTNAQSGELLFKLAHASSTRVSDIVRVLKEESIQAHTGGH